MSLMCCLPEQYLTHLVTIFPPIKVSCSNQQIQMLITKFNSMAVIENNVKHNYHYDCSSILRQLRCFFILHCINTILYLFTTIVDIFTMVDLLISQLNSISNGMITNNSTINNNVLILPSNNVLFLLFQILSIVFVFGYCNDCKSNGNTIVGININNELYIFKLKTYFNNMKSISIRLIFCLINILVMLWILSYISVNNMAMLIVI